MVFPSEEHPMKRSVLAVLALLLALAGCGSDTGEPERGAVTATADLPSVEKRWNSMTGEEQEAVCTAASGPLPGEGEVGGYSTGDVKDYKGMLNAIEDAGFSQQEAAAMIPYALNECR
jgi:hypothetical protein